MANRNDLMQDAEHMEAALEKMGKEDGIWQNNLIRWLCIAVYHLLIAEIRRVNNEHTNQGR